MESGYLGDTTYRNKFGFVDGSIERDIYRDKFMNPQDFCNAISNHGLCTMQAVIY